MFLVDSGGRVPAGQPGGCRAWDAREEGVLSLKVDLIRESLELVLAREDSVTPRFYATLFSRYPEVIPLFSRNRPERQQQMLQEAIVAPEGRIHFAGEHTSLYHAWIQGALESGIRAAKEIHEAPVLASVAES